MNTIKESNIDWRDSVTGFKASKDVVMRYRKWLPDWSIALLDCSPEFVKKRFKKQYTVIKIEWIYGSLNGSVNIWE